MAGEGNRGEHGPDSQLQQLQPFNVSTEMRPAPRHASN
jgi:hypothetical protein